MRLNEIAILICGTLILFSILVPACVSSDNVPLTYEQRQHERCKSFLDFAKQANDPQIADKWLGVYNRCLKGN